MAEKSCYRFDTANGRGLRAVAPALNLNPVKSTTRGPRTGHNRRSTTAQLTANTPLLEDTPAINKQVGAPKVTGNEGSIALKEGIVIAWHKYLVPMRKRPDPFEECRDFPSV